jgi:CRP/FNR family transcriptional regulator, anaerobic regulatory protein
VTAINKQATGAPGAGAPPMNEEILIRHGVGAVRIQALLSGGRAKYFAANEVIYREREQVDEFFLIRSGLVKVLTYLPNGHARIIRLHGGGQWFGLERLMGQPCGHTAIAVGDLEVARFSIPSRQCLHRDNPDALEQLIWQWHYDLVQADKWISDFSTGDIKSRVARLLAYLAELEHGPGARTVELLTVNEMGEILGVTPESVSRVLAAFKRCDILSRERGRLKESFRLDLAKLQPALQS